MAQASAPRDDDRDTRTTGTPDDRDTHRVLHFSKPGPHDEDIHELIAERYERTATLVTSNLDFDDGPMEIDGVSVDRSIAYSETSRAGIIHCRLTQCALARYWQ